MYITKTSTARIFQKTLQTSRQKADAAVVALNDSENEALKNFGMPYKQVYGLDLKLKSSQRYLKSTQKDLESMKKQDHEMSLYGPVLDETKALRTKREDVLTKQVDTYTKDIKDTQDSLRIAVKNIDAGAVAEISDLADKDVARMFGEKVVDDGVTIDTIIAKYYKKHQGSQADQNAMLNLLPSTETSHDAGRGGSAATHNVDCTV